MSVVEIFGKLFVIVCIGIVIYYFITELLWPIIHKKK